MKVVSQPEMLKWEKNCRFNNNYPLQMGESRNCSFVHNALNGGFGIKSRDFYEKCMVFEKDGAIYKYSASVNNSEEAKAAPDKDTIRGVGYFSMIKAWRDPADQKVHYMAQMQSDFKLEIPAMILGQILPNSAKGWMKEAQKHYTKNHKNL